jgi:hypothetical protein
MKYRYVLPIFLLITSCFNAVGQINKPAQVANLYQQALQLYAEDNFVACLTNLERAEKLSPTANAKILYLKIKTLYQLNQTNPVYTSSLRQAYTTFITVASRQNYPPDKIKEIANLQPQIQAEIQRSDSLRIAFKSDSIKKATIAAIYTHSLQLYAESKWTECVANLERIDSVSAGTDLKITHLKIKALYPLFTKSSRYTALLEKAFRVFNTSGFAPDFPAEKRQEVGDLEVGFRERMKQIEIEKTKRDKIIALYTRAEQLYEADNLTNCLARLDELAVFLGGPTAKILYLKIKSLDQLFQTDKKYSGELENALTLFFKTADPKTHPALKIAEINYIKIGHQAFLAEKIKEEKEQNCNYYTSFNGFKFEYGDGMRLTRMSSDYLSRDFHYDSEGRVDDITERITDPKKKKTTEKSISIIINADIHEIRAISDDWYKKTTYTYNDKGQITKISRTRNAEIYTNSYFEYDQNEIIIKETFESYLENKFFYGSITEVTPAGILKLPRLPQNPVVTAFSIGFSHIFSGASGGKGTIIKAYYIGSRNQKQLLSTSEIVDIEVNERGYATGYAMKHVKAEDNKTSQIVETFAMQDCKQ